MNFRWRWRIVFSLLFAALVFTVIFCTAIGPVSIGFFTVVKIIINSLPGAKNFMPAENWPITYETIVFNLRLARVILALLVGAALATSGVVLQGLLQNPMGDPYILGISSGAALGATTAILFGLGNYMLGIFTIPAMAFLGGAGTTFVVYNIAKVGNRVSMSTLLLAGIAVGSFLSAVASLTMVISGENLHQVIFWLMGGLSNRGWKHVMILLPYIIIGIIPMILYSRDLNVMLLGEESAQHMGVEVEKLKKIMLGVAALVTASAVSVSGIIGFVGLIIPHIVRLLVGPDHRVLLPASALLGAIFLAVADTLARVVAAPLEIPVGIITALCGGPFFLYLLRKKKNPGF
ncbi:MAG: iron chelate uptake ABC transporter family permease subunit [Clostridiales bacterium]|nr:iron chelate uptake ABC transporter family permease subunit [Clostridiales bacterium]MCF8021839.1 iron chelate uptake ABC transporter family permease subunit [Clostridiales bacterium]